MGSENHEYFKNVFLSSGIVEIVGFKLVYFSLFTTNRK